MAEEDRGIGALALHGANLQAVKNLTVQQLGQAKTLYQAHLDPGMENQLKEKFPQLFSEPQD